jgi:hypothetical protein
MMRYAVPLVLTLLLASPGVVLAQSLEPLFSPLAGNNVDGSLGQEERRENPFEDHIETDRDSFTPSTRVVGFGRVVVESALTFEDHRGVPESYSFPELVVRIGICKRVELRLGFNAEIGGGSEVSGGQVGEAPGVVDGTLKTEYRLTYGAKIATTDQKGLVPDSAIILQGSTPTAGPSTATQFIGTYVFGWELPARCRLDASFRYELGNEEGDHFNGYAPSVVFKVPVLERWTLHAEYFGEFSTDKDVNFTRHYISPGFAFLVTRNLEIGSRVGWGLNDQSVRFFCNAGFGYRF